MKLVNYSTTSYREPPPRTLKTLDLKQSDVIRVAMQDVIDKAKSKK